MTINAFRLRYRHHLIRRGYEPDSGVLSTLKRTLLDSWTQPGFHRFWQVWNPGVGYLLYLLYLRLGGPRRRALATVGVFLICGLLADVAVGIVLGCTVIAFSGMFFCFGLLTLASRKLDPLLRQQRWPTMANAAVNVSLMTVSIYAGVILQRTLCP